MKDSVSIPFNKPSIEGQEIEHMRAAVAQGHISASGPYSESVREILVEELQSEDVLLTPSCTDALEMTAMLLDLGPEDTVIIPSFTFVSTALAFARQGARILFCDIDRETLGLDPDHLSRLMDESVRAVVVVHYAGISVDLTSIQEILSNHPGVELIEDNAHGLFGSYREEPLGSFGRFGTLSFHETKNFICGEGGALIINRGSDVERAHVMHDKGTNRRAFMLGQVDKYSWQDLGSSFGLSDVLAAYLFGQLECRTQIWRKRRHVYLLYRELLEPYAGADRFILPNVPNDRRQAYHMFFLLLPDASTRAAVLKHLRSIGVQATFHYVPLNTADGAQSHLAYATDCPVTREISERLIRLPFHNQLTDEEVEYVANGVLSSVNR